MSRSPAPTPAELDLLDPDGKFRQRLAMDRQTILQMVEAGDESGVVATIHRLAGAAGTFGFADLGEIAIALDDAVVAGDRLAPNGLKQLLGALARAIEKSA